MRVREPRWARFARAAVGESEPAAPKPLHLRLRLHLADVRRRISEEQAGQAEIAEQRRPDARLLPAVVGSWAAAAVAVVLPGDMLVGCALLLLGVLLAGFLAAKIRRRIGLRAGQHSPSGRPARHRTARHRPARHRPNRDGIARCGSASAMLQAAAPTLALTTVCIVAVLASVALHSWSTAESPLEQAMARGDDMVLTMSLKSSPRPLGMGNGPPRVAFDAVVLTASAKGQLMAGRLPVRVVASMAWAGLQAGDRAVTAGIIVPAGERDSVAGFLRPSTGPQAVKTAGGGSQAAVTAIRASWISAVHAVWDQGSGDTAGLLPGMVMGDRAGMDTSLDEAMKTVGLTHLTAVSGANCTLVLASLMLALRSLRVPRGVAFAASGAGLLGFVMVVGPDPSVLRAAVMGTIGAMAVLGGRPKRVGALLSLSIVVLLLGDPWLASDYAFILSVLATLGLHLVGQRCVQWLTVMLPLWLAQAIAIPLAAQLFCAPVIVLLQARLTPYTIPANMLAAPVVALVTTVGTLGMVVAAVIPPLAAVCAAISGAGAWWVAAVARTMSALPAASLPWPAGVQGVVLMSLLNAALLAALFVLVERERATTVSLKLRSILPSRLRDHWFVSAVVLAAGATAWWSTAVLNQ